MPELPEVEVVRAGLASYVTGARVLGVDVFEPRSLRRHDRRYGDFESLVTGRVLGEPTRRGKFLWIGFADDPDRALLSHLGMSGQILVREPGAQPSSQLRIRLHVEAPRPAGESSVPLWVDFVDQRIFGSMAVDRLVPTSDGFSGGHGSAAARVPEQVAHIARDPLDPAWDDDAFVAALATRRTGIKRVLLDQGAVSGIGNIYADESLWASRIHGEQPAATLDANQAHTLIEEVRTVLWRALAEGGTSFDEQYKNVNGQSGYFAHSLTVYGQQGKPCPRCGTEIRRERFMNRSSHFCPTCQSV